MKCYGVIMAGGGGTRFWPLSRQAVPKQLLNLSGKGLMINETIERITQVIREEDVFIVTNAAQARTMEDVVVPGVRRDHILVEPAGRNTAACGWLPATGWSWTPPCGGTTCLPSGPGTGGRPGRPATGTLTCFGMESPSGRG